MITCAGCGAVCSQDSRLCPSCGRAIAISATLTREASAAAGGSAATLHPPQSGGFSPGVVLAGRYRIVALLGRGGMGEVYRAEVSLGGRPAFAGAMLEE